MSVVAHEFEQAVLGFSSKIKSAMVIRDIHGGLTVVVVIPLFTWKRKQLVQALGEHMRRITPVGSTIRVVTL